MSTIEPITPKFLSECIASQDEVIDGLRFYLDSTDDYLLQGFRNGERIENLVHDRAKATDLVLEYLWQHLQLVRFENLSLIAVGGYGRSELHPYSDIDILILCHAHEDSADAAIVEFITILWDIGLKPGHSVRALKECEELARDDVSVMTNLLESRIIAGPHRLLDELRYLVSPHNMWTSEEFFLEKRREQKARHERYHSTSYSIEPNLKESPGGLRDIQTVSWIAKRHFKAGGLYELTHLGVFSTSEYRTLASCLSFLWKVRYALHLVAGRGEERLLFDYQKRVAELLGFESDVGNAAVEAFMKKYFRTVMKVRDLNDLLLQVFEHELIKDTDKLPTVKIDHQFQKCGANIESIDDNVFEEDPSALLRIFIVFIQSPDILRISASTLRLITENKKNIDKKFRQDENNKKLFLDIFRVKGNRARALTLLKRSGILGAYLPAFRKISGQMQFDMFHVYTVDEHTLFLLRNLANFTESDDQSKFPICRQIMENNASPEVIYMAGLFHDIAKGRGGDHSTLGAQDAAYFCKAHNLPSSQKNTIVWLVENHLLMSSTAQKKDISDPDVIGEFARIVRTIERLDLLYILTVADIRATNPTLWNSWKDSLLRELYLSTKHYLESKEEQEMSREDWLSQFKKDVLALLTDDKLIAAVHEYWDEFDESYFMAHKPEQIIWHLRTALSKTKPSDAVVKIQAHPNPGGIEIFVNMPDKANIIAAIGQFLAERNLSIQSASIQTVKGECFDSFVVLDNGQLSKDHVIARMEQDLRALLIEVSDALPMFKQRLTRQMKSFNIKTEVNFINADNQEFTIMELYALEQPGLLSAVARAFTECKVEIRGAKIVTLGERVEDVFTICDKEGKAIQDPDLQHQLRKTIKNLLD